MSNDDHFASRRDFLKNTGKVAAATALAGVLVPPVHAAEDNTIRVALVGCGGRGTGAAANAMSVKHGPVKLVAMADVFQDRLDASVKNLIEEGLAARMDVPKDRQFLGFDAYKKAMDCLRPGDVAIFTTPPAFRWVHFTYAIQKGLNVFMEKPVAVDGPSTRRMFALAEKAKQKNLKVAVGLMSRHARPLQELAKRVHGGEIGEPILLRGYRMHAPAASFRSTAKPANISELAYQIQRFHSFLWASGGCFSDFYIHIIDNCCWMKDDWPISAQAVGGRHYRQDRDGVLRRSELRLLLGRIHLRRRRQVLLRGPLHGGLRRPLLQLHPRQQGHGDRLEDRRLRGPFQHLQRPACPKTPDMLWQSKTKPGEEESYQNEWNDLVEAIRHGQALQRGAARHRGQPGHRDGPHGRPHRPG